MQRPTRAERRPPGRAAVGLSGGVDFDVANNRLYLWDSSNNRVLLFNFVRVVKGVIPTATAGVTSSPACRPRTPNPGARLGWRRRLTHSVTVA